MKACHPDLSGNDTDATNFCMFINDVYEVRSHLEMKCLKICLLKYVFFFLCFFGNWTIAVQVLSDPVQRMVYDEIHGFALTAINPFLDDSCPKDHAFVDEFSCIGTFGVAFLVIPHSCAQTLILQQFQALIIRSSFQMPKI